MKTSSTLRKYLQALEILPDDKDLPRPVLYDYLEKMGGRWNSRAHKWFFVVKGSLSA
jgi:hypothetical protein